VPVDPRDRDVLFSLVEDKCTKDQIEGLLREKGAPLSAATKSDLMARRVMNAVDNLGRVTLDELATLLSQSEEHGKQHVFLYSMTAAVAAQCFDRARIRRALTNLGAPTILDTPRVLDMPANPRFTECRVELAPAGQDRALVLKRVTRRETRRLVNEGPFGQNQYRLIYDVEQSRHVDVVKLHSDGMLEVRLQTYQRPDYARDAQNIITALTNATFLPPANQYNRFALVTVRRNLYSRHVALADEVKFSASRIRTPDGNVIYATTGRPTDNLFDDVSATSSVAAAAVAGSFDETDVFINGGNDAWVHVVIRGEPNEFFLTAQSTMSQYNTVLETIRRNV